MATVEGKINAVYYLDEMVKPKIRGDNFPRIDEWEINTPEDMIVTCQPGFFIAPLTIMYKLDVAPEEKFNYFILGTKKCYNSPAMREHLFKYINYYLNFYDFEKEYLSLLFKLKIKSDRFDSSQYPVDLFFYDVERYLLNPNIRKNVHQMVEDCYFQCLDYKNIKSPSLQYTNEHAKLLHEMSIIMDLCIPVLTNYAYMHKIDNIDEYLLRFYDKILHMDSSIDMYAKLFETAYTNVIANQKNNQGVWIKQDIRAIDTTTHSTDSVQNIILNIMPKYTFDKNIISFNYASIRTNTNYKITDISFEFSYVSISSSKRDSDSISDFDKFEANLIRENEAAYLQNKVNCREVLKSIETRFGPFSEEEIKLYKDNILVNDKGELYMNTFQKQLIFNLFFRFFRDTQSIYAINQRDYIKLVIAAKRMLLSKNMIILPYIISGKVEKLITRKTVNKKERTLVESSSIYPLIQNKYKNDAIVNHILGIMATIISSDFMVVDIDPTLHGTKLNNITTSAIVEEVEEYILMC